MRLPYAPLRNALFTFDAESVHDLALTLLSSTPLASLLGAPERIADRPLDVWNLRFRNPLGLAAGFDKNAVAIPAWRRLGFGFCEVGTVTRRPQKGNPRPRIFRRSGDRALINRMGFPNDGAEAVARRLVAWKRMKVRDFPVGVNIGRSRDVANEDARADYLASFTILYEGADFFVVNVSSPNTPGLRELQSPDALHSLVEALHAENARREGKPLLIKISPDLDDAGLEAVAATARDLRIDGIVVTNTTVAHAEAESGGLSGAPLLGRSTSALRALKRSLGADTRLIACGGVEDGASFDAKINAGASLVEVYTGFVYRGPDLLYDVLDEKRRDSSLWGARNRAGSSGVL